MTRSRPSILILLAILGGGIAWLIETALVTNSMPMIIPPVTLAVALGLIGLIVIGIAVPVYRVVTRTAKSPIDPFYATRVVLLAKASSITGALLGGAALAVVFFVLSRPVMAGVGSISLSVVSAAGALILLIGGLVAEKMCTLPPEDEDTPGTTPTPS